MRAAPPSGGVGWRPPGTVATGAAGAERESWGDHGLPTDGSLFLGKVRGTCSGTSGVTAVKGNFMTRLPSNDCTALATTAFPASDFGPVRFTGPGAKYTKSTTTFSGGEFGTSDPVSLAVPGTGGSSTIESGSFAGQTATMTFVMDQTVNDFITGCGPKQKGVKGSGGLKKMTFGTTSSLDIS
jgi:hypothetical protein